MMIIVKITGGLGNQMFIYAYYLYLQKKHSFTIVEFDNIDCLDHHNGFELKNIFSAVTVRSVKFIRRLRKIYRKYFTRILFKDIKEEYNEDFTRFSFAGFYVLHGYWQSERFVNFNADSLKKTFKFCEAKLNTQTKSIIGTINQANSVSIHIRRGDYIANESLNGMCDVSYYERAIEFIQVNTKNPIFFICTDDENWVKSNFNFIEYTLID